MLLTAVANGALRDLTYGKHMTELAAHQLSTATACVLLGVVMWIFLRRNPPPTRRQALEIGLLWLLCTVAFEFLFFHYVGNRSWQQLAANYNVLQGRVWVLLLAWVAAAPPLYWSLGRAPVCADSGIQNNELDLRTYR
jgi:hypothetical protein